MPRKSERGVYESAACHDLETAADLIDITARGVEYFNSDPKYYRGVDPKAIRNGLAKVRKALRELNKACRNKPAEPAT